MLLKKNVSYCSTVAIYDKGDTVIPNFIHVRFRDYMTTRLNWLRFYIHPECSFQNFELIVKMETEHNYFSNLDKNELFKIDPNIQKNLSYSALQRFSQELLNSDTLVLVPDDILQQALLEEHNTRISPNMQTNFSNAEVSLDIDWLEVVNEFQSQIATKYAPLAGCSVSEFLTALRFQHCNSFTPLWRVFNRADKGTLEKYIFAPDCYLWDNTQKAYSRLSDLLMPSHNNITRLTVLLAGSFS